jgi:hypothetical protein
MPLRDRPKKPSSLVVRVFRHLENEFSGEKLTTKVWEDEMKPTEFIPTNRNSRMAKRIVLLIGLLFACELLFLLLADFNVPSATQNQAIIRVESPVKVSGFNWGDLIPSWIKPILPGPTQVSGFNWGDLLPSWLKPIVPVTPMAGFNWGDLIPTWLKPILPSGQVAGFNWGDLIPTWLKPILPGSQIAGFNWGDLIPVWLKPILPGSQMA